MADYSCINLVRKGPVATLTLLHPGDIPPEARTLSHPELAAAFAELRQDESVRVVVLTGSRDRFKVTQRAAFFDSAEGLRHLTDPEGAWLTFAGLIRTHQTIAEMEKPVIARVNGDATGFGSSLAFACDLIVAREDAMFMDCHMNGIFMAEYGGVVQEGGLPYAVPPGDGGLALIPLFMTPCKAKEYLMLAQPYQASELAQLGIINYAVPAAELDAKVDDLVQRLLQRDKYALAWTKRVANRRVVQHLSMNLDAAAGYEMVAFLQREKTLREQGKLS